MTKLLNNLLINLAWRWKRHRYFFKILIFNKNNFITHSNFQGTRPSPSSVFEVYWQQMAQDYTGWTGCSCNCKIKKINLWIKNNQALVNVLLPTWLNDKNVKNCKRRSISLHYMYYLRLVFAERISWPTHTYTIITKILKQQNTLLSSLISVIFH